jgi:asparagine synthase (glutamine-hydrolysing)
VIVQSLQPVVGSIPDLLVAGVVAGDGGAVKSAMRRIVPMSTTPNGETVTVEGGALWVRRPEHIQRIGGAAPFIFAGRLDNRDEVIAALGQHPGASDTALAAAAWQRWGDGALPRLIGGFVLATWDAARSEMVLAVDTTGDETVYTATLSGCFAFAGHPRALRPYLEDGDGGADMESLARKLWGQPLPAGRTILRGVNRIPPGELWRIGRSGVRRQTYWRPGNAPPTRFRRDEDYVEAAREMLDRVVGCHLPADGRLAADLTGGLDSTSIVTAAARLAPHLTIDCLTMVGEPGARIPYDVPGRSGDEWPAVQATAAAYPNLRLHRIEAGGLTPEEIDPTALFETLPTTVRPAWVVGWGQNRKNMLARLAPCRLLSGVAGNLAYSRDGFDRLPELLAGGRWATLAAEIRALIRKDGRPWRWYFLGRTLYPALPAPWRRLIRRLRGHDFSRWTEINVIRPEAVARYGLTDSTEAQGRLHPREGHTTREGLIDDIYSNLNFRHTPRTTFRTIGVDLRTPLLDPRMIDFCLALPSDQFLRDGVTRRLARQVLAGRAPDQVTQRPHTYLSCPEWHHRMTRARSHWMAAIERLEGSAAVNELLDMPKLRRLAESWPEKPTPDQAQALADILPTAITAGQFIRWANREN